MVPRSRGRTGRRQPQPSRRKAVNARAFQDRVELSSSENADRPTLLGGEITSENMERSLNLDKRLDQFESYRVGAVLRRTRH